LRVEISKVELPTEIYPAEGKHQDLPSLRLQSSSTAEGYFLKSGVDSERLREAHRELKKPGVAVL